MEKKEMKNLAVAVYNKQIPTNYTASDFEGTLRDKFKELAPDYNSYRRNKLEIFEIIQEVVDTVAPKRVIENIGVFADVKSYGQGDKPKFRVKKGRNNVKRFITKVGLGGVYERVRLDKDFIDVTTHAYGGAGYVEFEQFLDGNMDFSDLIDLILDSIELQIYKEIHAALVGTFASLPANNKYTGNAFLDTQMIKIINTVKAYGGNATIIATPEFASTIIGADKFIGDAEKSDIRNQGYIGRFYGADVVVLPQSFEDETNTTKVLSPQYAVVIPTGGSADEKIVKVLLEGQTVVDEVKNADGSMEFQAYKKLGTVVLNVNFFGLYQNTALS